MEKEKEIVAWVGLDWADLWPNYETAHRKIIDLKAQMSGYFMAPLRGSGGGAGPTNGSDGKVYTMRPV